MSTRAASFPTARRPAMRRGGFTLPEVLAALVLIGVTLPAIMKGVSLSLAVSDDARRKVEATGLAESKLAELIAGAKLQAASGGGSGDFGSEYPGYRWAATTNTVDTDVDEISVQVTWAARGAERSVSVASMAYTGTGGASSSSATTTPPPAGTGGGS